MDAPSTLQLKKFDIAATPDECVVIMYGKRNSGKSTLVAEWLYQKKHIPVGIVMSATEEASGFFKKQCGIPDSFIYHEFNAEVLQRVIDKQKALYQAGKKRNCFIVLDDIMYDAKAVFNEKCMRDLFLNSRHYGIFLLFTTQTLELPVYARGNADYVCVLREPTQFGREKLYKTMFSICPTYKYFCTLLSACTENFECLVLNNTTRSNDLTDNIFWFKAKVRADHTWKMGGDAFHKYHKQHYRPGQLVQSTVAKKPAKPPGEVQVVKVNKKKK